MVAWLIDVPRVNPLFEVPTKLDRLKIRHAWCLLVTVVVTLHVTLNQYFSELTIMKEVFYSNLGPFVLLALVRKVKDPRLVGVFMMSFYSLGGTFLFQPGKILIHIRLLNLLPMSVFILGNPGAVLVISQYLFLMIFGSLFPDLIGPDPPLPYLSELVVHCVIIQIVIIVAFQAVNDGLERSYEQAVNYRFALRNRMSHELRTPLFGIVAATELLKKLTTNCDAVSLLKIVDCCTQSLICLVTGMIDLTQLQNVGKLEMELKSTSLTELVEVAVSIVSPLAMAKRLPLKVDFNSEPPLPENITTDPLRTKQVLVTLLSNAIKFTSKGEVKLTISRQSVDMIRITVQDTGIGMDSTILARLFGPPPQTSVHLPSIKTGLALSQYLITSLGGSIAASSPGPMKGSTFDISLPVNSEGLAEKSISLPTVPTLGLDSENVKSQELLAATILLLRKCIPPKSKALIVEDNALNQMMMAKMLDQLELNYDVASNGVEALRKIYPNYDNESPGKSYAEEDTYCLLFVDLEMPVMDGPTCIAELRRRGCELPIVLMSAHPLSEQQKLLKLNNVSVHFYLTKPFNSIALCNAILSIFKHLKSPA